jgi:hypothetical protein
VAPRSTLSAPTRRALPAEVHLCRAWRDRRVGAGPLIAAKGETVEVVYPGRWRRTPGPDFQDAILSFDGSLRHGDVEAHRCSSGWREHGHHNQSAYNGVILHLVLVDDAPAAQTSLGAVIPTLCLPVDPSLPEEPPPPTCPVAVAHYSRGDLETLLDGLGQARARGKAAALEGDLAVHPPDQVLYEALCEGLGYSRNRQPMRELAQRLPLWLLAAATDGCPPEERAVALGSLLLGGAGLLPSQRTGGWSADGDEYLEEAELSWVALSAQWDLEALPAGAWHAGQTRPENRPARRVAAAGWLLARHWEQGLLPSLLAATAQGPAALEDALAGGADDGYWTSRTDFGLTKSPTRLIGQQRAADLAMNAVLPLAYAYGQKQAGVEMCDAAMATYKEYPARGENEITRYMAKEMLQTSFKSTACRQQGLLHLYRGWCQDKACDECPAPIGPGWERA